MASIILLISSLVAFSIVARLFGKEILSKRHHFPFRTGYSYGALKLERNYKLTAYGIMLALLFYSLVMGFIEVLSGDPF